MNDKVEKVMNEWSEYRQEVLDRHDPSSEKGTNEMRILLQTSVWMDKLYRATINGDAKKKPGRKPGPQPKAVKKTVKKRKRRTKAEMEAARAEEARNGLKKVD